MVNRRHFILGSAAGLVAGALPAQAFAAGNRHETTHTPLTTPDRTSQGYRPVITPNGRTLGYRLRDGVKEFHLIAEEIEHSFGDGTTIKAWGYNGSTPGPTLEAVEGDRVRIYVTNRLKEPTSVHWHGLILPNGMDGVAGLTQPSIPPGKTFVYEFPLVQHGTHMYHPHSDEMVQMAMGMMGMFIIHPREPEANPVDRDYAIMLHNWAIHPGTYRPNPSIMQDFDLWTMNSKVFPFIDSLVAQTGERVRIRMGNLSMWNHPMHAMGHDIPNTLGVNQNEVEQLIQALVPGYMAMGEHGMGEHQTHVDAGHMPGPENTLAMMMGKGQFGNMEMGGMFTVIKVRDQLAGDPGWYQHPAGTVAHETDRVPNDLPK